MKLLYAVFRMIDDVVDVNKDGREGSRYLAAWRKVFKDGDPSLLAVYDQETCGRQFLEMATAFDIPRHALVDFIDKGVSVDLSTNRFRTFSEAESYCYGVAGTVGLACLPIFGVPWQEAREFAVRLGIAVQWINLVRDVGTDSKMGRIYLPLDHLKLFGYTERALFDAKNSVEFQQLMKHEAGIARSHYKAAQDLLPPRWERELLPARVMGRIYLNLLDKLERRGFPVFTEKVSLNIYEKGSATLQAVRE